MPTLYGVNLSPFVRKVRVGLAIKGIAYDAVPTLPFGQPPEFLQKSPLGKIPLWEEDGLCLPDSSVILDYLEHKQPEPRIYPVEAKQRARALWYEEYADSRLVEVLSTVFFQRFVNPRIFKKEPDTQLVEKYLQEKIPPVFDYLERELGDRDVLVGNHFSIADIAVTSPFVSFALAGERPDKARWPRLAAYVDRQFARPFYKPIVEGDLAAAAAAAG